MALTIGHDVVDIAAFNQQMQTSSGLFKLFSKREQRHVQLRAQQKHDAQALHYAGKWAAKEAFIKAWCQLLDTTHTAYPYTINTLPWEHIEILAHTHGSPYINLTGPILQQFATKPIQTQVSISHDGNIASAVVLLEYPLISC